MKFTYQFMGNLTSLLRSDNWQADLTARIIEIENTISELPNSTGIAVEQKLKRWNELSSKGKIVPSEEKQQEIIAKIHKEAEDLSSSLMSEKEEIKECLSKGKYKLGVGVFKTAEDASLLLLHIHLLYDKDLGFNPDSVQAVESMLRDNFNTIYDAKIHQYGPRHFDKDTPMVEKFLSGEITADTILEELGLLDEGENLNEEQITQANNALKTILVLDAELVKHAYAKLKPFSIAWHTDCGNFAFSLASCFFSKEDIDNYLANSVDFTSFETVENSIEITDNAYEIFNLSMAERNVWGMLNAQFGKQSIKLFGKANDLKKSGFDIAQEFQLSEDLTGLFNLVKTKIYDIKLERENENEELAQLARAYNISETTFNRILDDIIPHKKDGDQLPNIIIKTSDNKYTFTKLPAGDVKGLFLGKMTACCQFIGGDSEKCVIDGFTKDTASFYVLTDKNGIIKAQSYAWIGLNDANEKVLILDSFEHLPETKKYFLELVQNLSNQVKTLGYADLYVGAGGKTPHLNQESQDIISTQDSALYRYSDSDRLYKITEDSKLYQNDIQDKYQHSSLDALIKYHSTLSFNKLLSQDRGEILKELETHSMRAIMYESPILNHLLSEGAITIAQIKQFFTLNDRGPIRILQYNDDIIERYILAWKEAIKISADDCNYSQFMSTLDHLLWGTHTDNHATEDAFRPYRIANHILDLCYNLTHDTSSFDYFNLVESIKSNTIPLSTQEIFNSDTIHSLIASYCVEEAVPLAGDGIESKEDSL